MNYLKIAGKGWETYTGFLGPIEFKDGVSVHPVPQQFEDRLSASMRMIKVDEEGNEIGAAGIAHRLVTESASRAPVTGTLARQSSTERRDEQRLDALRAQKAPVDKFYTAEELEEVVEKTGIKGLREVGDPWGVKERSIPGLIEQILKAQTDFFAKRDLRIAQISERQAVAAKEAEENAKSEAARKAEEQAEADRLASVLSGHEDLAEVYVAGDKIIPAAVIIDGAWKASNLSLTGWNKLDETKRSDLLLAEIERLDALYGIKLEAKTAEEPAPKDEDKSSSETLVGSSVLASTYEIGGKTIQLANIVNAAFVKFGGTVEEWNALADDAREDLLRLQLDELLNAVTE